MAWEQEYFVLKYFKDSSNRAFWWTWPLGCIGLTGDFKDCSRQCKVLQAIEVWSLLDWVGAVFVHYLRGVARELQLPVVHAPALSCAGVKVQVAVECLQSFHLQLEHPFNWVSKQQMWWTTRHTYMCITFWGMGKIMLQCHSGVLMSVTQSSVQVWSSELSLRRLATFVRDVFETCRLYVEIWVKTIRWMNGIIWNAFERKTVSLYGRI